ncbi:MAG: F0F1 ATP synthase subunit B [Candidatus Eiseniibacteriota bacterium]
MNLIDIPQVATQILGFLLLVWILRKYAWGPVLKGLEERREKIAGEFREADRVKEEARELKTSYEVKLSAADAEARTRIQDAVAEGQRVAAEIKVQAQAEATQRLARADDEMMREREKAKEQLKEQIIKLSLGAAAKILRQKLDEPSQRKLAAEFVDEVGSLQ